MSEIFRAEFSPNLIQRVNQPNALPDAGTPNLVEYYSQPYTKELREKHKASIDALVKLLPLDYMGSAEFEFNEIPKTLRAISQQRKDFVYFKAIISGIPSSNQPQVDPHLESFRKDILLQGWCYSGQEKELTAFLENQIKDAYGDRSIRLKERTMLQEGCFGILEWAMTKRRTLTKKPKLSIKRLHNICGWLSLDNGWFVGVNNAQVKALATLLGLDNIAAEVQDGKQQPVGNEHEK